MQQLDRDEVSVLMNARPQDVYALCSDVTRTPEFSPEVRSATWIGGATGPAVGARFKGTNSNGKKSWSTACRVTACEPGRAFGFAVRGGGLPVADWNYTITPTSEGCHVVEQWTDHRGGTIKFLGRIISGVADRAPHNQANMKRTLEALARAAE